MLRKYLIFYFAILLTLFISAGCDEGGTDDGDKTYTNTMTINGETFDIAAEAGLDNEIPNIAYDSSDSDRNDRAIFIDGLPSIDDEKASLEIHFTDVGTDKEFLQGNWTEFSANDFIGVGLYWGPVDESTDYLDDSYYHAISSSSYTLEMIISGDEDTSQVIIEGSFTYDQGTSDLSDDVSFSISYSGSYEYTTDWEQLVF